MAQRWMQAKDMLGKKHGFARSGASRPTGEVVDDRNTRRIYAEPKPPAKPRLVETHGRAVVTVSPIKRKINGTVVVLKDDRTPKVWQPARTTFDY